MLLIRHSEKAYDNKIGLDAELTDYGHELAYNKFVHLYECYDIPTKIVTSPYLRTRLTALEAQQAILDQTGKLVPIYSEPLLSEFLNSDRHQYNLQTQLSIETLRLKPFRPQNKKQFYERMKRFVNKSEDNVWYITHGYNIQVIAEIWGYQVNYPDYVGGVYLGDWLECF
jgi:hypothetical protein